MMRLRWVCPSTLSALGAVALLSLAACGDPANGRDPEVFDQELSPPETSARHRGGVFEDAAPGRDSAGRPTPGCQQQPRCDDHGPIDCVMDGACQLEVACVVTTGREGPMPFASQALALREQPDQRELVAATASPERLAELSARLGGKCTITCANREPAPRPAPIPEPGPGPLPKPGPICETLDAKRCALAPACELSPAPLCGVMCIRAPCPPLPCGEPRCVPRQPEPPPAPPLCATDADCDPLLRDLAPPAGSAVTRCAQAPWDVYAAALGKPSAAPLTCVPPAPLDPPLHCVRERGAAVGRCQPLPAVCPAIWQPVCGDDGKTYGNVCEATRAGARLSSEGECAALPARRCYVGGCSGELCSDRPDLASTCEVIPRDRCRRLSECGPFGPGGACAWSRTDAFTRCVAAADAL